MEISMLGVKELMFLALELVVLAIIVALLVAAVCQIVREKVRESRWEDQIPREIGAPVERATHRS
jgi:Na+-translocating ferredoxin:NAD+ oxidoreductase RnfG subunit